MSEGRLNHLSYVVLGVIAVRGPTTSYQLKQYVAESIAYLWPLQHATLYREPRRLEDLGLLQSETEDGGRRRQFFTITPEGLACLRNWLRDPVTAQPSELHDEALLKLHFGELADPSSMRELAENQIVERKTRLAYFTDLQRRYQDRPGIGYPLATLRAGQMIEKASIAFWREIAETADELTPVRSAHAERSSHHTDTSERK
ncbi:PadR family transcriptional regulator [Mycolicibacterium sp. 018/SC-01/001]|uniref:PadR family transcriptional regulator n=1 Tax=Mycolicibacterium sp. 018/SC-01/001 TaxID=2592069 RepID=UPI00117C91C5|nr:PadR family transcriptional regulator [Mycolicibacterium sp. 018/SC-01/001]TRW89102.1 PadR family transcriptional regulator [Mycolicibacterium sp. 018/SC-01/001]